MHVINTVIPVFLVIALGAYLRKREFFTAEFVSGLNRLVYWIGLPCLLFYKIASAPYDFQRAWETYVVVLAGTFACIAAGYVLSFFLRLSSIETGTLVQGVFRGNLLYIGIPVIVYSFTNSSGFDAAKMETTAILVLALMVPVYNITAVIVLLVGRHKIDRYVPVKIIREIVTNPILISSMFGILYSIFFAELPLAVSRSCKAIGQIALPLALFGVGSALVREKVAGRWTPVVTASLVKILLAPVVGWLVAEMIGLGAGETRIALLFLACPTATVSYIFAVQFGGEKQLAAVLVVVSTVLSILSLSLVVGFF